MAATTKDHNLEPLKAEVADAVSKINQFKLDRAAVNQEIQSIRETMAAKGIKKKALDMGMAYLAMDEDERKGFDLAYSIVREATGLAFKPQGDLFIPPAKKAKTDESGEAYRANQKKLDEAARNGELADEKARQKGATVQ